MSTRIFSVDRLELVVSDTDTPDPETDPVGPPSPSVLTPRQTQVLTLLAHGYTVKQIRLKLGISRRTIVCHLAQIRSRIGAETREEAVAIAVGRGLIVM